MMLRESTSPSADVRCGVDVAAIYDQYADRIYSYALRCCHNPTMAEDIVATTFQRALEHLPSFDWRGVPISAWLYRVASNQLAAHYRRRQTLPLDDTFYAAQPDEDGGPEHRLVQGERGRDVCAAVATLPLLQRQAIVLRYGHGLRFKEIALILGRSEGTIKQVVHRAHLKLRERLADDMPMLEAL
jgi:RNA polymerase sigma-70 factor (ECF subfamily)